MMTETSLKVCGLCVWYAPQSLQYKEDALLSETPYRNGSSDTRQDGADPDQAEKSHWLGRPDPHEKPLSFWHVFIIILSGHLGVRTRAQREEDFRRANGLHIVIAAFIYFAVIVAGLVVLVNWIATS